MPPSNDANDKQRVKRRSNDPSTDREKKGVSRTRRTLSLVGLVIAVTGAVVVIYPMISSPSALTLKGHPGTVTCVAYSPEGSLIASGGHAVRIWDSSSGRLVQTTEPLKQNILRLRFSPDGRWLAGATSPLNIWDVQTGAIHKSMGDPAEFGANQIKHLAFSPDSRRLAAVHNEQSLGRNIVTIWDFEAGKVVKRIGRAGQTVAFSPDGLNIVSGLSILNASSGLLAVSLKGGRVGVTLDTRYSPDGTRIASVGTAMMVGIWDAQTGNQLHLLRGHTDFINGLAFSKDGGRIATASNDKTIRIWDVHTGSLLQTLEGHEHAVTDVDFHPNGNQVVSSGWDKMVRVWDVDPPPVPAPTHTNQAPPVMAKPDTTLGSSKSSTGPELSFPHVDDPVSKLRGLGATLSENDDGQVTAVTLLFIASASDEALFYLKEIKTVESVAILNGKAVTDRGIQQLQQLPNLKSLSLVFCSKLTDASAIHLSKIKTLKELQFFKNRTQGAAQHSVTPAALDQLKIDLPNCKILAF